MRMRRIQGSTGILPISNGPPIKDSSCDYVQIIILLDLYYDQRWRLHEDYIKMNDLEWSQTTLEALITGYATTHTST